LIIRKLIGSFLKALKIYGAFMTGTTTETTGTAGTTAAAHGSVQQSWMEQDPILREMWLGNEKPEVMAEKLGRSVAAIMTRAARLGLPRRSAPGRKPGYRRGESSRREKLFANREAVSRVENHRTGKTAAKVAEDPPMRMVRVCLMCLKRFPSEGRHNRICPSCKNSAEYSAGSGIPDSFREF